MQIPIIDTSIAILKRRRWFFLVPFLVLLVISIGVILLLPKSYESTGLIGVESQQIPEDFVRSTITTHAGERVGMIEARVMTNANLEQLIERLNLYSEDWDREPMARLVAKLEKRTSIDVIRDPYASQLGAIAFAVSFEDEDPETARIVATELVNYFLEENVATRTDRAAETTEFLEREAARLGEKVSKIDQEIAEFKQVHRNALPEHLDLKISMVNRAESDLRTVEMEISSIQQERRFLQTQSASSSKRGVLGFDAHRAGTSLAGQLGEMKAELAVKSREYQSAHPDIQMLEATIEVLEAQISSQELMSGGDEDAGYDPARAKIDSQYRAIASRMGMLREQEKALRSDIERLQGEILEIPLVEIELRRLTDQYNVFMDEYGDIRTKRYDATLALSLEQEQKAERFILLEPPQTPLEPKRSLFMLLGLALLFSVGGGAGIAYLAEMLDNRIYGRNMLESLVGQPPLAVIPYLDDFSDSQARPRRKRAA